ncbi:hypothetical protein OKHIL_74400 [Mycolicibacterium mageritense]
MIMIGTYDHQVIDFRHLAALQAIAEEGTFGRVAARLGYTQSTLSQQIRALEQKVGGVLFDRPRGPKPPQLTPLGRLVLSEGRELLARYDGLVSSIERFKAGDGRVDIGTFQTVTNVLLPPVMRQLRKEHPHCDIRLYEEETARPALGELDLMFFDGPGGDDVDSRLLLEDDHVLIARRGDLPPGPVRLQSLDAVPMVALPAICDQARVEAAFAAAHVAPRMVFRTADNQAVVSTVRAGLGWAVMPVLACDVRPDDSELSLHPLTPRLPRRPIYVLTAGVLSPLANRVVELASRAAADLVASRPRGPGERVLIPRASARR